MGWYLRKSFNCGPLRLNLSKSGLGVSVGVAGLRIGKGPRGAYELALALYEALQGEPPATVGCGFGMLWRLRELMGAEAGPDPTGTIVLRH